MNEDEIFLGMTVLSFFAFHDRFRVFRDKCIASLIVIRAVKKIDKDRFLSISSILSIIDKNLNLPIGIDFY